MKKKQKTGNLAKLQMWCKDITRCLSCLTNSSQLFTVVLIWQHFATNLFQYLMVTHQGVHFKTRSGCSGFEKIPCIDHTLTAIDIDKVKVISGLKGVLSGYMAEI